MADKRKKVRGGAGTKKYYRNEVTCRIYRNEKKYEKSHIKRIEKHLFVHLNDKQAKKALVRFENLLRS